METACFCSTIVGSHRTPLSSVSVGTTLYCPFAAIGITLIFATVVPFVFSTVTSPVEGFVTVTLDC